MLKMRPVFAYLAVFLGLFSYIYFVDQDRKSTAQQELASKKIVEFDADTVTGLEITNARGSVAVEKHGGKWQIVKPIAVPADEAAVNQMLTEFEFSKAARVITPAELPKGKESETLKSWGLETPAATLKLKTAKGELAIYLGRKIAVNDLYYAKSSTGPDGTVYLLPNSAKLALDKTLSDLRSRQVFDVVSSQIQKIGVRQASEGQAAKETEIQKNGEAWLLQKPLLARADKGKVNTWVGNLLGLRVVDFVSEDNSGLSAQGLSSPPYQMVLTLGPKNEENTLLIGNPVPEKADEVYAKRLKAPSVFTLNKSAVDQLLKTFPEIRDRHVLALDPARVDGIRWESKGKSVAAVREKGQWVLQDEKNTPANAEKIQMFLRKLAGLECVNFVKDTAADLKSYGLDKPAVRLVVQMDGVPTDLLVGKTDKTQVYVKSSSEPFIYGVAPGFMDDWPKEPLLWRNLSVLAVDKNRIKQLIVTGAGGGQTTLERVSPSEYRVDLADYSVDAVKAEAQVSLLAQLQARRWLGPVLPVYGLGKPVLSLTLGADRKYTVKIGATLSTGGKAALLEGDDTAFELSYEDYELLDKSPVFQNPPGTPAATSPH
jgi:hypothetical protein